MKKLSVVFAFVFCFGCVAAQQAGSFAFNAYGAYVFKDKADLNGFTAYINEGFQYGGGLEYYVERMRSLELKYLRQDTRLPLFSRGDSALNSGKDEAVVSYILLGGTNYFEGSPESKLVPYGGVGVGAGILDAKQGGSVVKVAWDARLGLKIKSSSKVSIKLQASLQSIIAAVGTDLYMTSVGSVALPDYATIFQFGLGGALSFNF